MSIAIWGYGNDQLVPSFGYGSFKQVFMSGEKERIVTKTYEYSVEICVLVENEFDLCVNLGIDVIKTLNFSTITQITREYNFSILAKVFENDKEIRIIKDLVLLDLI